MPKINMHVQSDLPGGVYCPPIIDIVERKISLIHQLQSLVKELPIGVVTHPDRNLKDMINIELQAICDLISIDKDSIDVRPNIRYGS